MGPTIPPSGAAALTGPQYSISTPHHVKEWTVRPQVTRSTEDGKAVSGRIDVVKTLNDTNGQTATGSLGISSGGGVEVQARPYNWGTPAVQADGTPSTDRLRLGPVIQGNFGETFVNSQTTTTTTNGFNAFIGGEQVRSVVTGRDIDKKLNTDQNRFGVSPLAIQYTTDPSKAFKMQAEVNALSLNLNSGGVGSVFDLSASQRLGSLGGNNGELRVFVGGHYALPWGETLNPNGGHGGAGSVRFGIGGEF